MTRLIIMSAVGGIAGLLLFMLKPVTKRLFGHTWQYYIWLVPLFTFVLPLSFEIPKTFSPEVKVLGVISPIAIRNAGEVLTNTANRSEGLGIDLTILWLVGVLGLFSFRMVRYFLFCRTIKKGSWRDFDCSLPFEVRRCGIKSPVMVGLFRPVLYIPKDLCGGELDFVIAHESVHYNRRDIIYKWFAVLVQTIHWFNPVSFLILRQIDEECEISCDYTVSRTLDESQRRDYMRLILSMASKKRSLASQMADSKLLIKKRFSVISGKRHKKKVAAASIIAVVIAVLSLLSSGVAAGIRLPEKSVVTKRFDEVSKNDPSVDEPETGINNAATDEELFSGYAAELELANEPVNTSVDETFVPDDESIGFSESVQSEDDGYLPGDLVINEISVPMSGGEVIPYDSDERNVHSMSVRPGSDGKVSLHFDCDMPNAVADISISGLSEDCDTVGYNVPTNSAYRYDICGLEPGREYVIEVNTYCPGNYDINGNIVIY